MKATYLVDTAPLKNEFTYRRLLHWGIGLLSGFSLLTVLSPSQAQDSAPTPTPAPSSSTVVTTRPTLRIGSQGDDVKQLQAMLLLLGFYEGAVDGVYGASTAIAVADFQEVAGVTPDGIMGAVSWSHLLPSVASLSAEAATPPTEQAAEPSPEPTSSNPTVFPSPTPPNSTEAPSAESPTEPVPEATPPQTNAPEATAAEETEESASPAPAETAADPVDLPILRLGMRGPAVERLQERLKALGFYTGAIDGIFGNATKTAVETAQRNYDIYPDGVVGPVTWAALLR